MTRTRRGRSARRCWLSLVVPLLRAASPRAPRAMPALAAIPRSRLVLFSANSRWTTGSWFVPAGFFVPENERSASRPLAWEQVRESVYRLFGPAWVWPAYGGAALVGWSWRVRASMRRAASSRWLAPRRAAPGTRSIRVTRSGFATGVPLVCRVRGDHRRSDRCSRVCEPRARGVAVVGVRHGAVVAAVRRARADDRRAQRDATNRIGRGRDRYLRAH